MAGHGCKLLEFSGIAGNGWKWQKNAGNGGKLVEMLGNSWKWPKMAGYGWNGLNGWTLLEWLKMAAYGWYWLDMARIGWEGLEMVGHI